MFQIGPVKFRDKAVFMAPMEDISDPPFRRICKAYGPDMAYTEFISSEGLIRDAGKSLKKLEFEEEERPIGIQIFGHDVESMVKAAVMASKAKPDIIDLNFGCPVRKVVSKGAGAALLQDPEKMIAMTKAVVNATELPVTVKTRLGWDMQSKIIVDLAPRLQETGIKALCIHGRTRSQLYSGKSDWTLIKEVKDHPDIQIPIIGNGDIFTAEDAKHAFDNYGTDAIMVARGMIGNPWIFRQIRMLLDNAQTDVVVGISERVETCRKHLMYSVEWKGEKTAVFEMRKHYSTYFKGIPFFKEYKIKLQTAPSLEDAVHLLEEILNKFGNI